MKLSQKPAAHPHNRLGQSTWILTHLHDWANLGQLQNPPTAFPSKIVSPDTSYPLLSCHHSHDFMTCGRVESPSLVTKQKCPFQNSMGVFPVCPKYLWVFMLLVMWLETASAALSSPRDAGERRRGSAQSTYWENVSLDASSLHGQPGARETAVHGCPGSEWTREVLGWHLCGNIKLCKIVSGSHWCKFSGAQLFWFRGLAYFSTVPIQRKKINWRVRVMQKEILNMHLAFSWSIITYSLVIRKVKKHQRKIRKTRQCTSHFCCLQIFWSQLVCLQNYGDLLWFY